MCHNLVKLSQHFQILNDVRVLIRNQDKEQFVDWDIDVSNDIRLDMRALPAWLYQFGEVGHVLLHLQTVNRHELPRYQDLPAFAADTCADHYHMSFVFGFCRDKVYLFAKEKLINLDN